MSRGFPSMTALLALLAVAGYQNRDKLGELLGGARRDGQGGRDPGQGLPGGLGGLLGGAGAAGGIGGLLSGGLGDLIDRFRGAGQGEVADSWVRQGPNQPLRPGQLEQALGADTLAEIARQTGLSRDEVLARLQRDLPDAVDRYTPDGRLPPASVDRV